MQKEINRYDLKEGKKVYREFDFPLLFNDAGLFPRLILIHINIHDLCEGCL